MIPTHGFVSEFHETFEIPANDETRASRWRLLREEVLELKAELDKGNRLGIAQELADVVYVAYGTAIAWDIRLDHALKEVHRANMSKLGADGQPIKSADGEVLKGPNYIPPRMSEATAVVRPVVVRDEL